MYETELWFKRLLFIFTSIIYCTWRHQQMDQG